MDKDLEESSNAQFYIIVSNSTIDRLEHVKCVKKKKKRKTNRFFSKITDFSVYILIWIYTVIVGAVLRKDKHNITKLINE